MAQDPKKEVGEMGKPSLKAKFEAAMQKKFDSDNKKKLPKDNSERLTRMVKNVREDKDPDWYKKEAVREALSRGSKESLTRFVKDVKESKPKLLSSMSKGLMKPKSKY